MQATLIQKAKFIFLAMLMVSGLRVQAQSNSAGQDLNTITTAVPFLMIGPDARAGSMGDGGVASTPDASSMHWNPAKYAFMEKKMGFSVSYTPWLRALVDDINLAYLTGYMKLDDRQTIAASLRYFSMGSITFTNDQGITTGSGNPNEFAIDAAYSRKFSDKISGAVAARYIRSDLSQGVQAGSQSTKAGNSVAADVAFYYLTPLNWRTIDAEFAFGVNVSNIGSKISYSDDTDQKDFIPTNLALGPRLTLGLDDYNELTFSVDMRKLLVPTQPIYQLDEDGNNVIGPDGKPVIQDGKDPDVSVPAGMIQSFFDAPGGFDEELREVGLSLGVEYWYDKTFAIRGGYFFEDKTKGNRQYFTLGAGLRYNVFGLDFSYLVPTDQKNPLENTLRFSLLFDLDAFSGQ